MSDAVVQINELDMEFKIDGATQHPSRVVASMRINAYPTLEVVHHIDKHASTGAISVSSEQIFKLMGDRQTKLFSEPNKSDFKVSVKSVAGGGEGSSMSFKGALVSPHYSASTANVEFSDIILPEYAAMDNLNYACYAPTVIAEDINWNEFPCLASKEGGDNLAVCLWKVGEYIKDKWLTAQKDMDSVPGTDADKQYRKQQHSINEKVSETFQKLINNSAEEQFGWPTLADRLKEVGDGALTSQGIATRMLSMYASNTGSFFSSLCRYLEEWQCVYVPEWDDVGRIVSRKTLLEGESEKYDANIISLNIYAGGQGMFPVRYVAVAYVQPTNDPTAAVKDSAMVCYPKDGPDKPGIKSMIQRQAPAWIPYTFYAAATKEDGAAPYEKPGMSTQEANDQASRNQSTADACRELRSELLEQWAKGVYLWESLGNTYCTLEVPLDFKLKVGTRYEVKAKGAAGASGSPPLFTGFLTSVRHVMHLNRGKGQCTTTATFSHIVMSGATIPGVS